ncbi:MAG: FAD-binding oxidoreductase [Thermoleophilia bacterium]|jgi:glycolate oxidase
MALTQEQLQAFADIVGEEWVSNDPVDCIGWAWRAGMMSMILEHEPLFEAIIMPSTTEEVAAIVKECNKQGLQFKPSATGWGVYNAPGGPGVVKLDMRRMNKIIEINEDSMYAVVQSYVIAAELQAELMKRNLSCLINGAGGNCSALPICAHEGVGHLSGTYGIGDRNILACEWVTPEGDIVRLGTLGDNGEWFSGDGPGPSLRALIRGGVTHLGALGVVTAAAQKVYHSAFPTKVPVRGVSPKYCPEPPIPRTRLWYISWDDEEARAKAFYMMGDNEVPLGIMGFMVDMTAHNVATSNEEALLLGELYRKEYKGPAFCVIIAGNSDADFEYKLKMMEIIIEETNGLSLSAIEEGDEQWDFVWRYFRNTSTARETMRPTGNFGGVVMRNDKFEAQKVGVMRHPEIKKGLIADGMVLDESTDPFLTQLEVGQFSHSEALLHWRPPKPGPDVDKQVEAIIGQNAMVMNLYALEQCLGLPNMAWGDKSHDLFGPHMCGYHTWMRRIKRAFDPNDLAEGTNDITWKSSADELDKMIN